MRMSGKDGLSDDRTRPDITNSYGVGSDGQRSCISAVTGYGLTRRLVGEARLCPSFRPRGGRARDTHPRENQISVPGVRPTATQCGRTLEQGEALKRSLFLAIATIALVAAPASAQLGLVKPFQIGIAGGAAQPMSDLQDGYP